MSILRRIVKLFKIVMYFCDMLNSNFVVSFKQSKHPDRIFRILTKVYRITI